MRLKKIEDVNDFMKTVDGCKGEVFMTSQFGDRFNMKSKLMQMVAIAEIIKDDNNYLELWCSDREDENKFLRFFYEHPEVQ